MVELIFWIIQFDHLLMQIVYFESASEREKKSEILLKTVFIFVVVNRRARAHISISKNLNSLEEIT